MGEYIVFLIWVSWNEKKIWILQENPVDVLNLLKNILKSFFSLLPRASHLYRLQNALKRNNATTSKQF